MMATGTDADSESSQDYQILHGVREDILEKINSSRADVVNALIAKALSRKLIQSVKPSTAAAHWPQAKRERAEQFVADVLEAIRADASGANTELFIKLLEESALNDIATYLRGKLQEDSPLDESSTNEASRTPTSPKHPPSLRLSGSGGAYGGQPKLEPVEQDSAIASLEVVENGNSPNAVTHAHPELHTTQHQMTVDHSSGATFSQISPGVVFVEDNHIENLVVDSQESSSPATSDTQPHTDGPPSVNQSSVPVLPETKRMQQVNQDLRAELAERKDKEEGLCKKLTKLECEKKDSEEKLKKKEEELETVQREKDAEIEGLKAQIKEKEKKMAELQKKLSEREKENEESREQYEQEIKALETKIEKMTEQYNSKGLELRLEISDLKLELEKMKTSEEKLRRQVSEEKENNANLRVEMADGKRKTAEEKQKTAEEEKEQALQKHRDSLSRTEKLEKEVAALRQRLNQEPDTS